MGTSLATPVIVVTVLQEIVRTATEQSELWERWRLEALAGMGLYLLANPCRQGRPPKVSTVDTLPALAEQGVTDRRIAHRARLVARIPENVRRDYMENTEQPTERGLHRYAGEQQQRRLGSPQPRIWITPPEDWRRIEAEYGPMHDVCPYPRPAGYDALTSSWGEVGGRAYCNPNFSKRRSGDKHGPTDFVRKGISENRTRDVEVLFVLPIPHYVCLLAEAGAEVRPLGRIHWQEAGSGQPNRNPPNCALFVLRHWNLRED